jgi:CHAT domain-containing protein/Flp pilus assembly protein TadD
VCVHEPQNDRFSTHDFAAYFKLRLFCAVGTIPSEIVSLMSNRSLLRSLLQIPNRVRQGARVKIGLVLLFIFFSTFLLGIPRQQAVSPIAGPVWPGVVVEQVAKQSEGERAGLQEGDILLICNYGGFEDQIKSPVSLYDLEAGQKLYGPIRIRGLRNGEERTWTLGSGKWGIQGRPNFSQQLLLIYRQAQASVRAGNPSGAAEQLKRAASQISSAQPRFAWVVQWLLLQAGDLLADAQKLQEAIDLYEGVFQRTEASGRGTNYLLWHWADSIHDPSRAGVDLERARSFNLMGLAARARGHLAKAEEYYLQAVGIEEQKAPDGLDLADCLNNLGILAEIGGNHAKGEEYHRRALAIEQKLIPNSLDVAATLSCLGLAINARGDRQQADEHLRQAVEIEARLVPAGLDITVEAATTLGYHARRRDDSVAAKQFMLQAIAIQERLDPDSLAIANNFATLGLVAIDRGNLIEAEHYHRQALAIRRKKANGGLGVAKSLSSLALVARGRGELRQAEQYLRQALAIEKQGFGTESFLGTILTNLGVVLMDRNDLEQAEKYLSEALKIQEKEDPGGVEVAARFNNLGTVALDGGDLDKAQNYQQRALDIQQKLAPDSLDIAWSLNNLGNVFLARKDLAQAERYYRQALTLRERLAPGTVFVSQTTNHLAEVFYRSGKSGEAEQAYEQALAIEEKMAPESMGEAESLAGLASIMRDRGQMGRAAQFFERALATLEAQTEHLGGSAEIRSNFRANVLAFYNDYIRLLIEQRQPEQAFNVLERSRARSLLETLSAAQVDIRQGVPPPLLQKERALQAEIESKTDSRVQVLAGKHTDEQAVAIEKEITELFRQYKGIEDEIRVSSPAYAALKHPKPLSTKEIQQQVLEPGTLLLEYTLGVERSYVFAVSSTEVSAFELPKKADIEAVARQVYDILSARSHAPQGESAAQRALRVQDADSQYPGIAGKLSRMILGPVASLLHGQRLLIVRDGILEYVPFAALPSPVQDARFTPLIVDHDIVNLPSASVLQVLRQQEAGRKKAEKAIAVLADPVFQANDSRIQKAEATPTDRRPGKSTGDESAADSDLLRSATEVGALDGRLNFPRLLFSRKEADAIAKVAPRKQALTALDFNASLATAVGPKLSQYRIVHFATHGLLNSVHPELSGLVLSLVDEQGRSRPGFLSLETIYNMTLPVDLVVLSACETGLGKQIQGEGLLGITRGFMYAGASRVVASLWNVNDAATAQLMSKFYNGIFKDKLQPAAALRRAQVAMWEQTRWSLPYYWAGFVIQGEW